ncbi:hypothetical protein KUCAC02_030420 [Chaenocephalus aceratus]|uniref:Uncharacterized protein n=1 Tax=Chaenocephalus aceratus TaxID=36190 RepID=A0ACB9XJZ7_CHAAC|nr:hypothetical protein KUCAC02_030420 [Chaenocephalus aceratus]
MEGISAHKKGLEKKEMGHKDKGKPKTRRRKDEGEGSSEGLKARGGERTRRSSLLPAEEGGGGSQKSERESKGRDVGGNDKDDG